MLNKLILTSIFTLFLCTSCTAESLWHTSGRVAIKNDTQIELIGSASSITFTVKDQAVQFELQAIDEWDHVNYFILEIDGKYVNRFTIAPGPKQKFTYQLVTDKEHVVSIYKATEAANGTILFDGSLTKNVIETKLKPKKKIEFIGDSITCGMGNDVTIPCHKDQWFDQHNAYFAYGPVVSRKLNCDYLLSSVSGIGMYRNWNDEHETEPIMPDVYGNLYLNKKKWTPFPVNLSPDIVSICLGTNDFSDGDGKKQRLPFDRQKYTENYIVFLKNIYNRYPDTQVVLLNSPMLNGAKKELMGNCLKAIAQFFDQNFQKRIKVFTFDDMIPQGCDYHPDINDHQKLADQLYPFLNALLHEN